MFKSIHNSLSSLGADFPSLVQEEYERLYELAKSGNLDLPTEDGVDIVRMAKEQAGIIIEEDVDKLLKKLHFHWNSPEEGHRDLRCPWEDPDKDLPLSNPFADYSPNCDC